MDDMETGFSKPGSVSFLYDLFITVDVGERIAEAVGRLD